MAAHLIWKKSCDTCRKFKRQLDAWGIDYSDREINAAPLDAAEIEALIGARPVRPFLNPRNAVYRSERLKEVTPDRAAAAALIAAHNALLRRPILIVDGVYVMGNDLAGAAALLGQAAP